MVSRSLKHLGLVQVVFLLELPFHIASANVAIGKLHRYSDYGVVEQSQLIETNKVLINNDPFGYSDQYTDSESGLQYLQVRYYDPKIMRFTAMDTYPLLNRYAYANENPIMNDDPSGHNAVGASENSGSTNTGIGASGSAESLIGLIGSVGLAFVGLATVNVATVAGVVNAVTEVMGLMSFLPQLNDQAREGLSIASFVASTLVNVMEMGVAVSTYYRPVKTLNVAQLLEEGSLDSVGNDAAYSDKTRGSNNILNNNCIYRAMADQDFLTRGSSGGYIARDQDRYYLKMESIINENVTYSRWVTEDNYRSTILSQLDITQGKKKVLGVLLESGYMRTSSRHLITAVAGDDDVFFLESNSRSKRSLRTVLDFIDFPTDRSVRMSFFEVGPLNKTKLDALNLKN